MDKLSKDSKDYYDNNKLTTEQKKDKKYTEGLKYGKKMRSVVTTMLEAGPKGIKTLGSAEPESTPPAGSKTPESTVQGNSTQNAAQSQPEKQSFKT